MNSLDQSLNYSFPKDTTDAKFNVRLERKLVARTRWYQSVREFNSGLNQIYLPGIRIVSSRNGWMPPESRDHA